MKASSTLIFGIALAIFAGTCILACEEGSSPGSSRLSESDTTLLHNDSSGVERVGTMSQSFPDSVHGNPLISPLEQSLRDAGLVNVQDIDPTIRVDLAYSTEDNFLHTDVYGDLRRCYLQPEVAQMAAKASACLLTKDAKLRLIIFDGVRPRSVQYKMWDIVKGTDQQEYVAAPSGGGGLHNYGVAIDLGLYHVDTGLVDMGTPFDYFGELAQPRFETRFVKEGLLSQQQLDNRRALRACMLEAGFAGILSEWWHFNAFPKEIARQKYKIVE
ncbi:MAG: M15 family metallopeptidase [Bacteroidia bacterium]|nr:M15 family metallopeptidase [Bacteroidia bacterium]